MESPSDHKPMSRLLSLDAYRGFVMFLMLAEVLRLCEVSASAPGSAFWRLLCNQQSHAEWVGCSLHDTIQPGFYFVIGVALVFSVAKRLATGQSMVLVRWHAAFRALALVLMGIGIQGLYSGPYTLMDTLTQIGLSYGFAFMVAFRSARERWTAIGIILVGYWTAFALYPLPGIDFDYASVGVSASWLQDNGVTGFAAHWQKNSNLGWAFDTWLLNRLPGAGPFLFQSKGLATLNFIPSVATMVLGTIVGDVLRSDRGPWVKVRWLGLVGVAGLLGGWLMSSTGICPVVKSIWTPSWVAFSGGFCCLFMAGWYALVEIWRLRRLAFPFVVIGSNSILAYLGAHVYPRYAFHAPSRLLGRAPFQVFGPAYEPLLLGCAILGGYWGALYLLYRWKLFLRL
jgi:heparan-alpha-glucosaminide N-acetyltransferase